MKIAAPRLRAHLDPASPDPDDIDDETRLLDLSLEDVDLSDLEAEHLELSGCRLTRCKLAGSDLDKLILVDTELTQCDLANARWADAAVTRVAITSSRLTGFAGPGMSLQHATIRDSVLDFGSFRFTRFLKVEFADCRLQNADFVSADLSGTVFRGCDFTGAEFSQVKATGAVFVDCTWDAARGLTSLTGATVAASSPIDTLTFTSAVTTAAGITLAHPDELDGA
ncbi:pentapeptide repeat-containing protein [Kribbella sp. NBC_01510]|uniref:pentapeptide repeat-containing protein n=1 Tax=unclassified Kribbella TaxID=2644121 RepID=UPI002E32893B|nr:pentapeptide repeat-containing protein [Kribbella sp. NBC_01484]